MLFISGVITPDIQKEEDKEKPTNYRPIWKHRVQKLCVQNKKKNNKKKTKNCDQGRELTIRSSVASASITVPRRTWLEWCTLPPKGWERGYTKIITARTINGGKRKTKFTRNKIRFLVLDFYFIFSYSRQLINFIPLPAPSIGEAANRHYTAVPVQCKNTCQAFIYYFSSFPLGVLKKRPY